MSRQNGSKADTVAINLALQGGGAHGAFTWGVLDTLLQDDRVTIEGISGTSAGTMNACLVACGLVEGGPDRARQKLREFWKAVSDANRMSPIQSTPWDKMNGIWSLENNPNYLMFDLLSRLISPYQFNPTDYHPLRKLIDSYIDFDHLHHCQSVKLFITATCVRTGKVRVFRNHELTTQAILASACLPFLFQAVEIEGDYYWDGGYSGNPVLYPLINQCATSDIVIVQINPIERKELPTSAREIINRVNEISFNSSLLHEIETINVINKLISRDGLSNGYRPIFLHCIEADETLKQLGASSKFNADWDFLCRLKEIGEEAARRWVDRTLDDLGQRTTLDCTTKFQLHGPQLV
jgi:NTE family protein